MTYIVIDPGTYELRLYSKSVGYIIEKSICIEDANHNYLFSSEALNKLKFDQVTNSKSYNTFSNKLLYDGILNGNVFSMKLNCKQQSAHLESVLISNNFESNANIILCLNQFNSDCNLLIDSLYHHGFSNIMVVPNSVCASVKAGSMDSCVLETGYKGISVMSLNSLQPIRGTMVASTELNHKLVFETLFQLLYITKQYIIPPIHSNLIIEYILRKYGYVILQDHISQIEELINKTNLLLTDTGIVLPDGNIIVIDKERYMPYEFLFTQNRKNVATLLLNSLQNLDIMSRAHIQKNVILTGGLCCTAGFRARLLQLTSNKIAKINMNISYHPISANLDGAYAIRNIIPTTNEKLWISWEKLNEYGYERFIRSQLWYT